MNRLVTLILLMVWSACAQTATAAQERVLHFHAEITVHPDASLTVEETIAVQATGETIRRGIVREFPTRYTDSHGRTMEVGFALIRVLRDGHPEPYHVERRQNGVAIFIGAKDVFLAPGQYVYTIAYRTTRQLGFFAEHDELYWNVNGNGWRLPMDQVTGAVQLPPGATSFAGRAYEGPQGSTAGFDLPSGESRIFFASTRPYAPGEGLTIVVTWPKGWVTPSDDAPTSLDDLGRFLVAPQALSSPTATAAGLGLVLALGYYVFAWIRVGRDPAPGVIIPRFDPPKGFSPAMVRMLFHLGFDTTAMTAAIVNLAVRGLLCIKDTGSSSRSIKLTPPAVPPALPPGEAALWEALSARGRRHVRLDGSDHRVMRAARTALQHALEKELAGAYFRTNSAWTLPGLAITGMCMVVIGISTPQFPAFFFLCVWLTFWSFGCIAMLRQVWQGWKSPLLRQKAAATVLAVFSIPFLGAFGHPLFAPTLVNSPPLTPPKAASYRRKSHPFPQPTPMNTSRILFVVLLFSALAACAPKTVIRSKPPEPRPPQERVEPAYPRRIPGTEAPMPVGPQERPITEPSQPDPVAERLAAVLRTAPDWPTQESSGMELFQRQWETRQYLAAMNTLALLYGLTTEEAARASLESLALSRAQTLPPAERDRMLSGNAAWLTFPWNLVAWAQIRAQVAEDPSRLEALRPTLETILSRGGLVNTRVLHDQLLALSQRGGQMLTTDVFFFLPQSGPYAAISRRILLGAELAAEELKAAGATLQLRVIDAAAPGALGELTMLPAGAAVAGPLRKEDWDRITQAGLHRQLAFLTFFPTLPAEGQDGWRLLASPEDQAQSLVQAMELFGATAAAVLYPQDRFGMAMAPLFTQTLEAAGGHIAQSASYDPAEPAAWGKIVARMLGATDKESSYPLPPFDALFVPDSLLKAQQIVAFLHYYDAGHLLVLGPQLWGQATEAPELEKEIFRLAVFPSALNPATPQAQHLAAQAAAAGAALDGWLALGYDATRLVLRLPAYTGDPARFSADLDAAAKTMNWTMAPIHFDAAGRAHQALIPMQITTEGLKLPDWEALRQLRDQRIQKRNAAHNPPQS
jgi:ABC-type branched-subunit amino acid transport system substrate-binding protein